MSFNPLVSIIIPVHNGADFLQQAINSALAQTYHNIEVIVVNDGSEDSGACEQIALSYGERIRYFAKSNGGVASALNLAIAHMLGDYLSWLSHDDLYHPDKIAQQIKTLGQIDTNGRTVLYCDYTVFTRTPDDAVIMRLKGVPPAHFRHWLTVESKLHGCTLLIPRQALERCGVFNENLRTTQDYDLWFRLALDVQFVHSRDVLVYARCHDAQGSRKMAEIALRECNQLYINFVDGLSADELSAATGKSLYRAYADIASSLYRRGFNSAGQHADKLARQHGQTGWASAFYCLLRKISTYRDQCLAKFRTIVPQTVRHKIRKMLLSKRR